MPHTIHLGTPGIAPEWNYNCYSYAFGLADSDLHTRIAVADNAAGSYRYFASVEFAARLIQEGVLIDLPGPETGCIAIYTVGPDGRAPHAGIATNTDPVRVKSKWGHGGFWEHGLLEVPQRYGDHIRYFEPITTAQAETAFLEFCMADPEFEPFCERHNLTGALK